MAPRNRDHLHVEEGMHQQLCENPPKPLIRNWVCNDRCPIFPEMNLKSTSTPSRQEGPHQTKPLRWTTVGTGNIRRALPEVSLDIPARPINGCTPPV